jgi:hypothetical protein
MATAAIGAVSLAACTSLTQSEDSATPPPAPTHWGSQVGGDLSRELDQVAAQSSGVGDGERGLAVVQQRIEQEVVLGGPAPVDRRFVHRGLTGDLADADRVSAVFGHRVQCRFQDRFTGHCHVVECRRPGRIGGVSTATASYKGHR